MTRREASSADVAVAVSTIELVMRDIATISRVRPEIAGLLEDVGLVRSLQSAVDRLTGVDESQQIGVGTVTVNTVPATAPPRLG